MLPVSSPRSNEILEEMVNGIVEQWNDETFYTYTQSVTNSLYPRTVRPVTLAKIVGQLSVRYS